MAGRGPAPKDPAHRRNRNAKMRGEWVEVPKGPPSPPVLPELPEGWSERAQAKWAGWRADPASATFGPAEIGYAFDCLSLYETCWPAKAAEIRQREDGLGLTPKGKRDLRLKVVDVVADEPQTASTGLYGDLRVVVS